MENPEPKDGGNHKIVCRCECPLACANDTNAYNLWHKLSNWYERKNAINKASRLRKIVRLKYKDGESIVVHINTFMGLVNQLAATKFPLDDAL